MLTAQKFKIVCCNWSVGLRRLVSESSSEEVKKEAKGALWILEDKTPSEDEDKEKNAGKLLSVKMHHYQSVIAGSTVNAGRDIIGE